jgi:hypothetical protein
VTLGLVGDDENEDSRVVWQVAGHDDNLTANYESLECR